MDYGIVLITDWTAIKYNIWNALTLVQQPIDGPTVIRPLKHGLSDISCNLQTSTCLLVDNNNERVSLIFLVTIRIPIPAKLFDGISYLSRLKDTLQKDTAYNNTDMKLSYLLVTKNNIPGENLSIRIFLCVNISLSGLPNSTPSDPFTCHRQRTSIAQLWYTICHN